MAKQNQYFPQTVSHPGSTLEEKLYEMGMGPKEFALRSGKPEKTITAVLKGDSSITADMAVLFENVTRIPANYWMNHQRNYDEYLARLKHKQIIEHAITWSEMFPLQEMIKLGWLERHASKTEMAAQLLAFFGIASDQAWEDYYCNQQLKVAFRISLKQINDPYAVSAWLRKGELSSQQMNHPIYSEKEFKTVFPALKFLMAEQTDKEFIKIQEICLTAGVKVIYTPQLSKAPVYAATRWLNDTPLIQMTLNGKSNFEFWFTFFHEVGHILLHGKKEVFLEQIEYKDKDMEKEREADEFATKWTYSGV
jgi:addiction module HigA family antidote